MALTANQLNETFAITVNAIRDKIPDLFQLSNALYKMCYKRAKYTPGGEQIQYPLFFQENQAEDFIAGDATDDLNINVNQMNTYAVLDWKFFYYALSVTLKELTKTQDSPYAVKNLFKMKTKQAMSTMVRTLSEALHGTAVGSPNNFNGFGDIFAASGTAYAGINNTDVPQWFYHNASISATNYSSLAPIIDEIASRGSQYTTDQGEAMAVDLILSDNTEYSNFKVAEQLKQRFTKSDLVKSGFRAINVDGIDWVMDRFATALRIYILSTGSFEFFYKYGLHGKKSPLDDNNLRTPKQPIMTNINFLAGNLACNNRRVNAMVTRS